MAGAAIGALIGAISTGGGAYLFGATLWASVLTGASLGLMFETDDIDISGTPTYSFGDISNTKTQLLPIPVVYGRDRVAGNIFRVRYYDDQKQKADQYIGISEGPVHSITEVLAGDQVITDLSECSLDIYLNSDDNTSDSRDPGDGPRPYPNGLAFLAMTLKVQEKFHGNETITSIVEGREVWTPEGVMYTRNPVWIIRDFLTNRRYGFGLPEVVIDDVSFAAAAGYCDEMVEGGPRFCLDYVADAKAKGVDTLKAMLATFRAFIICREKVELHIDAPVVSAYKPIGPDSIVDKTFKWWQSGNEDILNRVIIEWIDPDNSWERTTTIFEDTADIEARGIVEKTFSLLGITRAEQAARMGAYLLDTSAAVTNFCSFDLSLKDADVEVGDVIAVTHELPGWDGKWMRVIAVADGENDSISVTCSEYVEEVYNDRAMDFQPHIDTNLPNPWTCPDVTGLTVSERVSVQPDGTILSNIDVFWEDPPVLLQAVEILVLEEGGASWTSYGRMSPGVGNFVIRGLAPNQSVSVMVRPVNSMGIKATGATIGLTLVGKAVPPGEPAGLSAVGQFRSSMLKWTNPGDADLGHIEIWESLDGNFGTAQRVADVVGDSYVRADCGSLETRWYWVRAVDTSGNVSAYVGPVSATTERIKAEDVPEGTIEKSKLVQAIQDELTSLGSTYMIRVDGNGRIAGMALLSDPEASEFTVLADKFFIFQEGQAGDPVQVFSLANGQLVLNADLFVRGIDGMGTGWITGDKIAVTSLIQLMTGGKLLIGDGGAVDIGNGVILMDTSGGTPRIRVNDPDDLVAGPYLEMTNGRLHLYKYIAGAHRLHAAVTRREQGVATSGQWAYLDPLGYWSQQPNILLSPKQIKSYDKDAPNADQMWSIYVEAIEEYEAGKWRFKPRAKLELSEANANIPISYAYDGDGWNVGDEGLSGYASGDDFWSGSGGTFVEFASPIALSDAGVASISATLYGRALGNTYWSAGSEDKITYAKRSSVTVKMQYRAYGASTWIDAQTITREFEFVSYNTPPALQSFDFSFTFPTVGQWEIRFLSYATRLNATYGTQSYTWDDFPADYISNLFEVSFNSGWFTTNATVLYPDGTVNYIAIGE